MAEEPVHVRTPEGRNDGLDEDAGEYRTFITLCAI